MRNVVVKSVTIEAVVSGSTWTSRDRCRSITFANAMPDLQVDIASTQWSLVNRIRAVRMGIASAPQPNQWQWEADIHANVIRDSADLIARRISTIVRMQPVIMVVFVSMVSIPMSASVCGRFSGGIARLERLVADFPICVKIMVNLILANSKVSLTFSKLNYWLPKRLLHRPRVRSHVYLPNGLYRSRLLDTNRHMPIVVTLPTRRTMHKPLGRTRLRMPMPARFHRPQLPTHRHMPLESAL